VCGVADPARTDGRRGAQCPAAMPPDTAATYHRFVHRDPKIRVNVHSTLLNSMGQEMLNNKG
jgi:hypothetical protein